MTEREVARYRHAERESWRESERMQREKQRMRIVLRSWSSFDFIITFAERQSERDRESVPLGAERQREHVYHLGPSPFRTYTRITCLYPRGSCGLIPNAGGMISPEEQLKRSATRAAGSTVGAEEQG